MANLRIPYWIVLFGIAVGCGGKEGATPGEDQPPGEEQPGGEAGASSTTPVAEDVPKCIISADCPEAQHCDLGECVQACNELDPCTGERTCSPRARCLVEGEPDVDPPPETEHEGTIAVSPTTAELTERDTKLELRLDSTSDEPVRYRIELDAPYLSVAEPRGEFTGTKLLELTVDGTNYRGQNIAGDVKVFTSLGEVVTSTPFHGGITGRYHGALRYDHGPVNLGDARLSVEVFERNGELALRVDPETSLLFPVGTEGEVSGFGRFESGQPISVVLSQRIEAEFGGAVNQFRRPIGRQLHLSLVPNEVGDLEGSFEEIVYGLFTSPVSFEGTIRLEYVPNIEVESFEPVMLLMPDAPSSTSFVPVAELFTYQWNGTTSACPSSPALAQDVVTTSSGPLHQSLASGTVTFSQIRANCERALGLAAPAMGPVPGSCGGVAPLACAAEHVVRTRGTFVEDGAALGGLMQAMAAPAALVSQDYLVQALRDSIEYGSLTAELEAYDKANAALLPVSTWFLQAPVLESLRRLTPEAAEAAPLLPSGAAAEDSDTRAEAYPTARALASILKLKADVNGERSRIAGLTVSADRSAEVADLQARALFGYLEAVALSTIVDEWAVIPQTAASTFTGVLTTFDGGFGALLDGAGLFGVRDGYVPFVYRADDTVSGTTNFEQELTVAGKAVTALTDLERQFSASAAALDNTDYDVQASLNGIRERYETEVADICGTSFDPASVTSASDWERCGESSGEVASARLRLDVADARLRASESRILGMKEKIGIDEGALAEKQAARQKTLEFVKDNGEKLKAITMAQMTIDVVMQAIQTASNSNLFNAGAPAALAAGQAAVGVAKINLEARRQDLQLAQTLRFEQQNAELEFIDGMANIQRQLIDLRQLAVEMQLDVLSILEARFDILNRIEHAKRVLDNRTRAAGIADLNPAKDPSFRVIRDRQALMLLAARARAQRELYLAGRALEYEANFNLSTTYREDSPPLPGPLDGAVVAARNGTQMTNLLSCLDGIFDSLAATFGKTNPYPTTVSVRELFGISGPRTDNVTGEELTPGQQFRMMVLRNQNLSPDGSLTIRFSTNLQAGNGLWSTNLCNDRIRSVQAQLVGDFQGDNEAELKLVLSGAATQRACDGEEIRVWPLGSSPAIIQAGVNTFGEAPPNTSLFGQAVARATWDLTIMGGDASPANQDLDLTKLEDVVLKITHDGIPTQSTPQALPLSCLTSAL